MKPLLQNVTNNGDPMNVPSKGKEENHRSTIHKDEIVSCRQRNIITTLEMENNRGDLHSFDP